MASKEEHHHKKHKKKHHLKHKHSKKHIDNNVQPRLAWEVTLLKIAMED